MEYHEVSLLLKSPSLQLLRAANAPMILSFLHCAFKREQNVVIPEGQLRASLFAYLDELRESDPLAYPKNAADYLSDWCSDSHGFLRRYYGNQADEPVYELTAGTEKAMLWLESLKQTHFVGTESRLESIFSDLEEILKFASTDPDERLRVLSEEAGAIQAEMDRIRATGEVQTKFTPVQINERYTRVLETARELLSDFRQVEDNFKRIAREIAERQVEPGITKGGIVGHMLDSHEALKNSEQGQSFFAFWDLLLSPERQARFEDNASKAAQLSSLTDDNKRNSLLRHFISHLVREGEKVVDSHTRMSGNLRRVLDTAHLAERRRAGELLQEIRFSALQLKNQPPPMEEFFAIESFPEVFVTMSRSFWQVPDSISSNQTAEVEENELGLEDLRRFRNLPQIRLQQLKSNVETCLARDYTVTLQQVLDAFPPRQGVMEVIGYLIVATNEQRHFISDQNETVELPEPIRQRWRIPKILFCKG
jgi:hypothetical protein